MKEIYERIYIANDFHCMEGNDEWAVVHACKSPCHQAAVGYRGNLQNTHPNYLVYEKENDLVLNIIDPPVPLFKMELFEAFLRFAPTHWDAGKKLLIHCNQGESRAPSLGLVFLAKHIGAITNESYEEAKKEFIGLYPQYRPGRGIQIYLSESWIKLSGFQK